MASVKDYPINFGFKAQDGYYYGPNGIIALFHHGEDRACPVGTDLVVSGKKLGESGNTGDSGGPHTHIDRRPIGTSITNRNNFLLPGEWWKQTGKVVFAGESGNAGNMVAFQNSKDEYRFLHLDSINVRVGDLIKGGEEVGSTNTSVARVYQMGLSINPSVSSLDKWTKVDEADLIGGIYKSDTRANLLASLGVEGFDWAKRIRDLQAENSKLKADAVATYEPYTLPQLYVKK